MHLNVPLPGGLSVTDSARVARAVSQAIEQECGFVCEPRLVSEKPLAVDQASMLGMLVTVDALLHAAGLDAGSVENLRGLRDWISNELQGSKKP